MAHLWPSIGPLNVWDLELDVWLLFARACDEYLRDQDKEGSRGR